MRTRTTASLPLIALISAAVARSLSVAAATPWLDVPYVRQSEAGCGAASIAMVMQYWIARAPARQDTPLDKSNATGDADPDRIYKILALPDGQGISGRALQGYLQQHGFNAFVFDGELRDLREHLVKGRPLVVCTAPKGSRAPLHFVVVVGLSASSVWIHDPVRGKLIEHDLARFQREWKAARNWTLLAVPGRTP